MRTKSRPSPRTAVKYPGHSPLYLELKDRVDGYFAETGADRAGGGRLLLKTAAILAWLVASYVVLVFVAATWWQGLLAAASVGLAVAGVGFNVQHDGGHGAYSSNRFVNALSALSLDLIGGSSYVWSFKHTVLHHHFTNVRGADEDIESAPFLRLAPGQKHYWFHRFQHWYAWLLFGFLPPKWAFYDDMKTLVNGKIGAQRIPRPDAKQTALLLLGKLAYVSWVLIIPLLAGHSLLAIVGVYAYASLITGITLAVVFQLAHCVEEAEFRDAPPEGEKLDRPWAEHQLATTVDFAPKSRFLTWYLGGLNFQVEHHLFPRVSHVHYPRLAAIVRDVCGRHGTLYRSHEKFLVALRSHVRHLRNLGRAD